MKREEFLLEIDEILGLRPGTLKGNEKLEDLENWDSTALISLIALAESRNVSIAPEDVVDCSTVADLLRLAQVDACPNQSGFRSCLRAFHHAFGGPQPAKNPIYSRTLAQ